jgi:hypothetical protein
MENIKIIKLENSLKELIEYVVINRGNDEFTSMLKSTYDDQQAAIEDVPASKS